MRTGWLTIVLLLGDGLTACGRTAPDPASATGSCGDGSASEFEQCDGAELLDVTCADLGFDAGQVRCSLDCCWSNNGFTAPTPPTGTFSQVSAGDSYTCGLKTDGSVDCWDQPTNPPSGSFSWVSSGRMHACAVRTGGSVACWGDDEAASAAPVDDWFS